VLIVGLVLLSAGLHALWNALLRLEPDKDRGLTGAIAIAALFSLAIAGARWAAGEPPFPSTASLGYTVVAGLFEAVYFTTLARALDRGRLGLVYTISRGGAVLVVWPLSIALFGEAATVTSTVGSVLVLIGLATSARGAHAATAADTAEHRAALGWALASAASIAGYHLCYKAALRADAGPSATFAVSLALAAALNLVRAGEGRRLVLARLRAAPWKILRMGVICGGSFLILMEALARGGSGFVLTLRNTSVLFATLMAWAIGEVPTTAQLLGAILVAGGAVVMSR
jgi:uncharacterized membrane protein